MRTPPFQKLSLSEINVKSRLRNEKLTRIRLMSLSVRDIRTNVLLQCMMNLIRGIFNINACIALNSIDNQIKLKSHKIKIKFKVSHHVNIV